MHHPHTNALVITVRVANSNVHSMLVDNGSIVDIIYLDAYKKMGLTESELNPTTLGEHPRLSTVMVEFLIIDCPSAFNGVIGRPLLKALKAITSIYHLTMKFPSMEETGQVRGTQYDSRECYNKSIKLAEKERRLPQIMEVGRVSVGPMETNIDPRLQEQGSTVGSIEELVEIKWILMSQAEL